MTLRPYSHTGCLAGLQTCQTRTCPRTLHWLLPQFLPQASPSLPTAFNWSSAQPPLQHSHALSLAFSPSDMHRFMDWREACPTGDHKCPQTTKWSLCITKFPRKQVFLTNRTRSTQAWCHRSGHLHLLPATPLQLRLSSSCFSDLAIHRGK